MDYSNKGGPAFPHPSPPESWGDPRCGMTLRDWFAGHAPEMPEQWLQDTLAEGGHLLEALAAWNYSYADAMLAAREKDND